jgi:cytochrome bd-type quinol oxidase subunit 2
VHFVSRDKAIEAYQQRDKMLSIFAKKDEEYDRFIQENAKENYYKVSKASYIITIILAITISLLSIYTIIQNINSLISNFSNFLIFNIITIVLVTLALTSHILYKKRERAVANDNTFKIFVLLLIANISIIIFNLQSISDLSL